MGFITKLYLVCNLCKFLFCGILILRVNSIKFSFFVFSNNTVYKAVFFCFLWSSAQILLLSIEEAFNLVCNQCLAHWIVSCRPHRLCSGQAMHIWIGLFFAPQTACFRIFKSVPFSENQKVSCNGKKGSLFRFSNQTHARLLWYVKRAHNTCAFAMLLMYICIQTQRVCHSEAYTYA